MPSFLPTYTPAQRIQDMLMILHILASPLFLLGRILQDVTLVELETLLRHSTDNGALPAAFDGVTNDDVTHAWNQVIASFQPSETHPPPTVSELPKRPAAIPDEPAPTHSKQWSGYNLVSHIVDIERRRNNLQYAYLSPAVMTETSKDCTLSQPQVQLVGQYIELPQGHNDEQYTGQYIGQHDGPLAGQFADQHAGQYDGQDDEECDEQDAQEYAAQYAELVREYGEEQAQQIVQQYMEDCMVCAFH